jgi:fructokinase
MSSSEGSPQSRRRSALRHPAGRRSGDAASLPATPVRRPPAAAPAPRDRPVVCFGEILWDFLPDGAFPGGAPFNVAYHLHQHGIPAHVASAVGRDVLGDELLRRLRDWGIPTAGIARHTGMTTGHVRATVGPDGDARYAIVRDVAWDRIPVEASLAAAKRASALVFGSLAQRSDFNRQALETLLEALPPAALRVFDVNLRPPHDSLPRVMRMAWRATLLKLNAAEAARLCGEAVKPRPVLRRAGRSPGAAAPRPTLPSRAGSRKGSAEENHARQLADAMGCARVVVTAGARGAGLLHEGRWHWEEGRRVDAVDTVGSGDAFLAALLAGLLVGAADATVLAHACRVGEWVATQRGATPRYDAAKIAAASR